MAQLSEDWFERLQNVHTWSEKKVVHYKGKDPLWGIDITEDQEAKECTVCGALDKGWGPMYLSCQLLTIYPGWDSPCRCTRRKYLEAHNIS